MHADRGWEKTVRHLAVKAAGIALAKGVRFHVCLRFLALFSEIDNKINEQ